MRKWHRAAVRKVHFIGAVAVPPAVVSREGLPERRGRCGWRWWHRGRRGWSRRRPVICVVANVQVKISIVRAPRDIDVLLAVAFVLFNCKENTLATIIRYLEARIEALVY